MEFISGKTVWNLHATHGFPIEISIPELADRGFMVTWFELLIAAKADGSNLETLIPRLCGIVHDAYTREFSEPVCKRLKELIKI